MLRAVEVVLVLLSPSLLFGLAVQGGRLGRALRSRRRGRTPLPAHLPVQRLAADARRLRRQLNAAEDGPDTLPGRGTRVAALRSAYTDCLLEACRALDVPPPSGPGADVSRADVSRADVFRVEAALRARGLDVAPAPVR